MWDYTKRIFWTVVVLFWPIYFAARYLMGIRDWNDICVVLLCILFLGLHQLVDEMQKWEEMRASRKYKKKVVIQLTSKEPMVECPICKGKREIPWIEGEYPQTCWKCSGIGEVSWKDAKDEKE